MARIFPTKAHLAVFLGSRAGEFSPLSLNPVAWWDGTDANTMNTAADGSGSVPTTGQTVLRWTDKVSSRVLTQDGAVAGPSWDGSVLNFDSSGPERLVSNEAASAWQFLVGFPCSVVLIMQRDTTTGDNMMPLTVFGGGNPYFEIQTIGSSNLARVVNSGTVLVSTAFDDDARLFFACMLDDGVNTRIGADNGVGGFAFEDGSAASTSPSNPSDTLNIGGRGDGSNALLGHLEHVLIFDRFLSDADVQTLYDELY